jgi:hypothetical protein
MNRSDQIQDLAMALAVAQGAFPTVKKDASNPFFKSKYADLAALIEAVQDPLSKNGLAVLQLLTTDLEGKFIHVETVLTHKSGQWISDKFSLPVLDWKPQGLGSATTYARRYALQAFLNLGAADDDGEAAQNRGGQGKAENEFAPKSKTPVKSVLNHGFTPVNNDEAKIADFKFSKAPTPVLLDAKQRQMFWADAKKVCGDEEIIRGVIQEVTGQDTTKGVHIHETGAILIRLRELMAKERGEVNPFDEEVAP